MPAAFEEERIPPGKVGYTGWVAMTAAPSYDSRATVGLYPGDDAREYARTHRDTRIHISMMEANNIHGGGMCLPGTMTTSGSTDTRKPEWITARIHESSRAKELDVRARGRKKKEIPFGASRGWIFIIKSPALYSSSKEIELKSFVAFIVVGNLVRTFPI